ncbi:MAG: sensor domain-containing protein [Micromonosporaceae bacterium]|nr:sensor domain-containing protein [Micromonosporaceae bacterium]
MPIDWSAPIGSVRPEPPGRRAVRERLRLTVFSLGYALAMAPALVLGILTVLAIALGPITVGFLIAAAAVPATQRLTAAHRWASGTLLGVRIEAVRYADTSGVPAAARPLRWLRDRARWRDLGFCWFSATGGYLLSVLPGGLLTGPLTWLVLLLLDPSPLWTVLLALLGVPAVVLWWLLTPALVAARARADRAILGRSRVDRLEERVEQVVATRSETLDHTAAEMRRIERDLHDGAQARIAAVGMSVGLAEKLIGSDPETAAQLLREARENTVDALEDLRTVVRGILPPVLADGGLAGAVAALAVSLPVPVSVALEVPRLPAPVESAAYFAVAECLANTAKHARASRCFVAGTHDGHRLRISVGDDGRGGAQAAGSGLSGVARRLAAFDGTLEVTSPPGGPTVIAMEVPCRPTKSG